MGSGHRPCHRCIPRASHPAASPAILRSHIDCASLYGNEAEVGAALEDVISRGVVKREELFITSKVWTTDVEDVAAALESTLSNLRTP